jgi:ArsR family transcriptional regulator
MLLKVMADETRLRIMFLLLHDECCVCELSGVLGIPQPRISQNLAKLRSLNLVKDRRQDKYMYYQLNKENALMHSLLRDLFRESENDPVILRDLENFKGKDQYGITCCGPKNKF